MTSKGSFFAGLFLLFFYVTIQLLIAGLSATDAMASAEKRWQAQSEPRKNFVIGLENTCHIGVTSIIQDYSKDLRERPANAHCIQYVLAKTHGATSNDANQLATILDDAAFATYSKDPFWVRWFFVGIWYGPHPSAHA